LSKLSSMVNPRLRSWKRINTPPEYHFLHKHIALALNCQPIEDH
jgi:hypothetical protein